MEHETFQPETQDDTPQSRADGEPVDLSDEMTVDSMLYDLHLPPGLDLLFQMLDEMSDGTISPPTEKVTPTPYYRTPTLGS
ncbi:hypothetical protein LDB30_06600 [Acidithiobacillus ferrooxidans]|jgi:hypothetical protein|nr:hypothetical protein [Ferrovum sp.]UBU63658.1 hypothetical protein LDB30_06600 [Acidithiobacillus ferrooxidans]